MKDIKQNRINHVVFVLDASSSIANAGLAKSVIKVADNLVKFLAKISKEQNQETRITIYSFADVPKCLIYDTDVLRLLSIAEYYEPYGWTALIDATALAIDDLLMTPQKYGDHAFIMYVISDGLENASRKHSAHSLRTKIAAVPNNWTFAALVPHTQGKLAAESYGFPRGNIEIWDATSNEGVEASGLRIEAATVNYMQARATGVRSTTNLFDVSSNVVNADAILAAGLSRVDYNEYTLIPIPALPPKVSDEEWALAHPGKKRKKPLPWGGEIGDFVRKVNGGRYEVGKAYYQLTENRAVIIQPNKDIMILDTNDSRIYRGPNAAVRKLLNLPENQTVKIKPTKSDRFRVYVKSTSDNRHLYPGAPLLLFK